MVRSEVVNLISVNSTGSGWQSGMTSAVRLAANKAATRADSNTFPLGTDPFFRASIVSGELTLTTAVAIALRSVGDLWVMLIMVHRAFFSIFLPGRCMILKNFFTPNREFTFYS